MEHEPASLCTQHISQPTNYSYEMKPFKPATTVSPSSAHPTQHLCVALSTCLFQVQSAVLRAAAEGRWEAIQQAFHLPDQKPLVLGARNEVSWAAQLTSSSPYIIPMCTLSSFSVQCSVGGLPFILRPTVGTFTWSSG